MRIALVGYGKMGHVIETLATQRGHSISARITTANSSEISSLSSTTTDVAIEFTTPRAAPSNLRSLLRQLVPVVCGTTGWLEHLDEITALAQQRGTALLYASNFSIGVNVTFAANRLLAKLLADHDAYQVSIHEVHHTSKKDAPSGTGITLAQDIIALQDKYLDWAEDTADDPTLLQITSERIDPAPGTHTITYQSPIDTIQLSHTAHSRDGFALGAVMAAEYIVHRQGIFTMADVLGLPR